MPAHTHADVAHQVVSEIIIFTALAGRPTPLINFYPLLTQPQPQDQRERERVDRHTDRLNDSLTSRTKKKKKKKKNNNNNWTMFIWCGIFYNTQFLFAQSWCYAKPARLYMKTYYCLMERNNGVVVVVVVMVVVVVSETWRWCWWWWCRWFWLVSEMFVWCSVVCFFDSSASFVGNTCIIS